MDTQSGEFTRYEPETPIESMSECHVSQFLAQVSLENITLGEKKTLCSQKASRAIHRG